MVDVESHLNQIMADYSGTLLWAGSMIRYFSLVIAFHLQENGNCASVSWMHVNVVVSKLVILSTTRLTKILSVLCNIFESINALPIIRKLKQIQLNTSC